ncbi:MAG: acetylxylan esterase [Bryobacteraceae bacterium]
MRLALAFFFVGSILLAQVPPVDSRNTEIPNTDTHFIPKAFWRHASHGTLAEWETRKKSLRGQILSAGGMDPMFPKTPLNAQVFGKVDREGYSIEKVLLETMPGYFVGGNLYRPRGKGGKFPGVLRTHGHWVHGRLENTELCSNPGFGISMARQGYVVFAWDMVGWNDTKQTIHEFGGNREYLWGFTPLGLQLWNSTRALDFLTSLPDVDPERVGMTGASGGGSQTFILSAVDDRVKVTAPVNMVSAIMQGGSPCENAPNLRLDTYNVEIAALTAPRPMILVSSPWDQSRNTMHEEAVVTRGIYSLYDKEPNLDAVQIEAQHNYNRLSREAVYRFFGHFLLPMPGNIMLREKPFVAENDEDMLALAGRKLPPNALDYEGIFREWRDISRKQTEETRDLDVLQQRLIYALGADTAPRVLHEIEGDRMQLTRYNRRDRVAGLWHAGKGMPLLVVNPEGAAAAWKTAPVLSAIAAGRPVIAIDAFQTGSAVAVRDRSHRYFLTFNKSDDANRVQDILTTLAYLRSEGHAKVELKGTGKAGIWTLFAAAVSPGDLALDADTVGFKGTDDDFLNKFFVPVIQRAGGLDAAMRITAKYRSPVGRAAGQ